MTKIIVTSLLCIGLLSCGGMERSGNSRLSTDACRKAHQAFIASSQKRTDRAVNESSATTAAALLRDALDAQQRGDDLLAIATFGQSYSSTPSKQALLGAARAFYRLSCASESRIAYGSVLLDHQRALTPVEVQEAAKALALPPIAYQDGRLCVLAALTAPITTVEPRRNNV